MSPHERGRVRARAVRAFFAAWQAQGARRITAGRSAAREALFDDAWPTAAGHGSPTARPAIERMHLLGRPPLAGLGDACSRWRPSGRRRCASGCSSTRSRASSPSQGRGGASRVRLRGKADRIDLLDDGTLPADRLQDAAARRTKRALQLPIYALCASSSCAGGTAATGRWAAGELPALSGRTGRSMRAGACDAGRGRRLAEAQVRVARGASTRIERGGFPPRPADASSARVRLRGRVPEGLRRR